jgi:hypothetical protein
MTNNKKQTIVDWIEQEMLKGNLTLKQILIQAKKMENSIFFYWFYKGKTHNDESKTFEQYYQETYGTTK